MGGFGFLGANILKFIDRNLISEYRVIVFDKFKSHIAGLSFNCVEKVYAGDFNDELFIDNIFNENTIDLVIHSISTTVPLTSMNDKYDVESNLIPSLALFRIMVSRGVKKIVYISSGGAVYGNESELPHKEDEDVFPVSSYGIVKLCIV